MNDDSAVSRSENAQRLQRAHLAIDGLTRNLQHSGQVRLGETQTYSLTLRMIFQSMQRRQLLQSCGQSPTQRAIPLMNRHLQHFPLLLQKTACHSSPQPRVRIEDIQDDMRADMDGHNAVVRVVVIGSMFERLRKARKHARAEYDRADSEPLDIWETDYQVA